jgi:hypothetical protein
MSEHKIEPFQDILMSIWERSELEWVFLPNKGKWNLASEAAVLAMEEVPPEMEDEPDAGIPQFAINNGLREALQVAVLQDIVSNFLDQKPNASPDELFEAFKYYYDNDAFITL